MVQNKQQHMHIFTYSPNCHQQFSTSIWFLIHNHSPSTQPHQAHNSHQIHNKYINIYNSYWLRAMRLDTTPICMWYQLTFEVVTPRCNKHIINNPNNWIQSILQHVMMHEHMTQSTTMHMFTQLQQSPNIIHYMRTPTIQHHCLYGNSPKTYMHIYIYNHQQHHHNNSTTIIMIINKYHHNQHQNIIMIIISIHLISRNSSKGKNL